MTLFGVDTGSRSLREADHLIHDLVDRLRLPVVACTHLIRGAHPHVAVSLDVDKDRLELDGGVATAADRSGPPDLAAAAFEALTRHGVSGRAVVFPGSSELTGTVSIADLLARSPITRLHVIGGPDHPGPDDVLDTRDHLRPEWQAGELVLAVTPAGSGRYAPFEVPNPTPCCADHH
ncbi:hypothetical protein [Kutzneria sp. NPDC052558]|uniref:hypothetical protein n=1 Tax=Kutzneria sp. NPDC052558 TaxID=3364121 RepID=UPI0037C64BE6